MTNSFYPSPLSSSHKAVLVCDHCSEVVGITDTGYCPICDKYYCSRCFKMYIDTDRVGGAYCPVCDKRLVISEDSLIKIAWIYE